MIEQLTSGGCAVRIMLQMHVALLSVLTTRRIRRRQYAPDKMHDSSMSFVDMQSAQSARRANEKRENERNPSNALTRAKLYRKTTEWMRMNGKCPTRCDFRLQLVVCLALLTSSATEMHTNHPFFLFSCNASKRDEKKLLLKSGKNSRCKSFVRLTHRPPLGFIVPKAFCRSVMAFFFFACWLHLVPGVVWQWIFWIFLLWSRVCDGRLNETLANCHQQQLFLKTSCVVIHYFYYYYRFRHLCDYTACTVSSCVS